jgi:hypothetical protein
MLNTQLPPGLKKAIYYEKYNFDTEQNIIKSINYIIGTNMNEYESLYEKETSKSIIFSINSIFKEELIEKHGLKIHTGSNIRSTHRVQSKYLKNKSSNTLNQVIFYRKNLNRKKHFDSPKKNN